MQESIKSTKNILKILTAICVVSVGIFLFWFIWAGQLNESQTTVTPKDTPEVSFVLEIPQKALWKNYFTVTVDADPGTTCDLLYIPPSGDAQEMSSEADVNGKCVWRWKIEESQGKGNGRLIITIDGESETHFFEIRSSF